MSTTFDPRTDYRAGLAESTAAEYDAMVAAGCEPLTPSAFEARVNALGYKLARAPFAIGAYVNNMNARHYAAYGVSYTIRATGDTYGRRGRVVSFANVDAPRDRLPELQALRLNTVVFSQGRVREL